MFDITFGEILLEEYLKPMGISQYKLAKEIGISKSKIWRVINNKHNSQLTVEESVKVSRYLGLSDLMLYNIQKDCLYRTFLKQENKCNQRNQ